MSSEHTDDDPHRIEGDSLGEKAVPAEACFGVQTQRAVENFPISGLRAHPQMVLATVRIKKAAARANVESGRLTPEIGQAIVAAADEVLAGRWHDQFVVDVFQAGAGTSHNMNANEVLANRAIEILGGTKGDYGLVHPNDHVNKGQSTNDVFPTAMRLATLASMEELLPALSHLASVLSAKGDEFDGILKSGRTHLQDAVPIRLGQEFKAYALTVQKCARRLAAKREELLELGIGGTAVGTGLNSGAAYVGKAVAYLREETGFELRSAEDLVEACQNTDVFAEVSATLRTLALDLIRIANDLRLLSSGPRTGLAEIELPAVQPGSSLMPGKVNPVIAEMMNMVCFQVVGNDLTISLACQAGQLELNVMMPVIAHALLMSLDLLRNASRVFADRCIAGITADAERCRHYAETSLGLVTALSPYIGYEAAAKAARESLATGKSILRVVTERQMLSTEQAAKLLEPHRMTEMNQELKDEE